MKMVKEKRLLVIPKLSHGHFYEVMVNMNNLYNIQNAQIIIIIYIYIYNIYVYIQ